jgi:hypothetical protein
MTRSPYGFIKTARRGSAYSSKDGWWIAKTSDRIWHLIEMTADGKIVHGRFSTLTAAAAAKDDIVKERQT